MGTELVLLDSLALSTMASGHLCLDLSTHIEWAAFSSFAQHIVTRLGGQIVAPRAESVEMRILAVMLAGARVSLVWDDYPAMVSFESNDAQGDEALRTAFDQLSQQPR